MRVTVSGAVSVTPNLLVSITTLNHHVPAIAPPNDASLQTLTISHFVPHVTPNDGVYPYLYLYPASRFCCSSVNTK